MMHSTFRIKNEDAGDEFIMPLKDCVSAFLDVRWDESYTITSLSSVPIIFYPGSLTKLIMMLLYVS